MLAAEELHRKQVAEEREGEKEEIEIKDDPMARAGVEAVGNWGQGQSYGKGWSRVCSTERWITCICKSEGALGKGNWCSFSFVDLCNVSWI